MTEEAAPHAMFTVCMQTPLDIQGESPPTLFKETVGTTWLSYLCIRMNVVLRLCRLPCKTLKQSLQQTKPVWIRFCSIASMHICCITFQLPVYNLRSACNFIGAHLLKASSASVTLRYFTNPSSVLCFTVFCCVMHQCSTEGTCSFTLQQCYFGQLSVSFPV